MAFCVWLCQLREHWQRRAQRLNGAAVAHEMRQPLLLLQLGSRRLLRHLEQLPDPDPVCVACVDGIHDASEQLGRSVAAMARLLRQGTVSAGLLNWPAVLCEALEAERQRLQGLQVMVRTVGFDAPLWIQGDGEQLGIAVANLLRNALDALAQVEPRQRRLLVRLQCQRTRACLTVADSGPGLPQDLAGLLAQGSSKPGGMGLGLVIVQAIAEAHGGELRAGRSRALGGAELRFRLPSLR